MENGANNGKDPVLSNGTDVVNAANKIVAKKNSKKKKKKGTRGPDKKPRAKWGSKNRNFIPVVTNHNNGANNNSNGHQNGSTGSSQTPNTSTEPKKSAHTNVDDMLKDYKAKLDPDTLAQAEKQDKKAEKMEDYTHDHVEDDDKNTTGDRKDRGNGIPPDPDAYTGEELVRLVEGVTSVVNPFLVRMLTQGRKKPTRKDFMFNAADKQLLKKSADKIADQLMGELTPMQQFLIGMSVVEVGLISEWVEPSDIAQLFKKKRKNTDQPGNNKAQQ